VPFQVFPNPEASHRAEWEADVSRLLNLLGKSVGVFKLPESELIWQIGRLFWQTDIAAMGRVSIDESLIYDEFSNEADHAIDEAISELVHFKWSEGWKDANSRSGYGGFFLKPMLFCCLDPSLRDTSPIDDAMHIATRLLDSPEDAVSVEEIDQILRWENRRLYPALWLLSEHVVPPPFSEGRLSLTQFHGSIFLETTDVAFVNLWDKFNSSPQAAFCNRPTSGSRPANFTCARS
jgi:hypothetical protein